MVLTASLRLSGSDDAMHQMNAEVGCRNSGSSQKAAPSVTLLSRLRDPGFRRIAAYGLSTALAAFLVLVLTRVLWRSLSAGDFGVWSLVDPALLPAASLLLLGIDHSIVKQVRSDHLPLRTVTGALLAGTAPATVTFLVITGVVARAALHIHWITALLLAMTGEALVLFLQTAFRATGLVNAFAATLISRNALYLTLLVALVHAKPGTLAVGNVILLRAVCVLFVSSAAIAALRPIFRLRWDLYCNAVRYGFPLLLTTFIFAISDMTDRWFLATFSGVVDVGIYSIHLRIAAILSQAIVIPFGLWFPPERFRHVEDQDGGERFFIQTAAVLTVVCAYFSGGIWLSRDALLMSIAPGIVASSAVLACCLAGVVCVALSQALNVGLLVPGHTGKNALCSAYATIATIFSAAMLVPSFGLLGAGLSRLAGGLVLVALTAALSKRVLPIAFPYMALFTYVAGSAIALLIIDHASFGFGPVGLLSALIGWTAITVGLTAGLRSWIRLRERNRQLAASH